MIEETIGPYQVVGKLGAGGMGEVYRARDIKLNRDVAVKALPDAFQHDPERVARFQREAQLLASLNHPNIGQIYGVEEANQRQFLILEFISGQSLASRLEAGAIPIPEALAFARQILGALEAAHDKGIVHRDLKPANVMVTADGDLKVLDFGLARLAENDASVDASNSPTLTYAATQVGVILGTAAYMSPEQAKGRVADKRSDVWAFGCVLFEMLTGKRAFAGDDVSDTLAAVLRADPEWSALSADVPAGVRRLIQRCLTRDRKARIPDIAAVRFLLDDALSPEAAAASGTASEPPRQHKKAWLAIAAAVAIVAALGAGLLGWRLKPAPAERHVLTKFSLPLAEGQAFTRGGRHTVAISPDGSKIVYVANQQLYLRAMDQLEAVPIRGTNADPMEPVFSPDSQWIAYFVPATVTTTTSGTWNVMKVAVTGGAPVKLGQGSAPWGASWHEHTIIFAVNSDKMNGIQAIEDAGGVARTIASVDGKTERVMHPRLTDDGSHLLFVVAQGAGTDAESQIVLQPLKGGARKVLKTGGTDPHLLPTGQLVYVQGSTLLAVPFDSKRLEVMGGPVPVAEGIAETPTTWTGQYGVSSNGTLVFQPGTSSSVRRSLVWVNRQGHEEAIAAPPRAYVYMRLSPDGSKIVVMSADEENDVWLYDLKKTPLTRLTFGPAVETYPLWTPDGQRVVYSAGDAVSSPQDVLRAASDGTGKAEALTKNRSGGYASSISPDGKFLVYRTGSAADATDLMLLPLDGSGPSRPLLADPKYSERNGEISPDGRWIAYDSNEGSQFQVYVRPFPAVEGGKWQISSDGATRPAWSHSGRELFFVSTTAPLRLMVVAVQPGASFATSGKPQALFDLSPYYPGQVGRTYDVAGDGRFVMTRAASNDPSLRPSLVVISQWVDEVRARVPDR